MPEFKLKRSSESPDAAQLREAIGAGPDEDVSVRTPQFTRTPDMPDPGAPPVDFESLRSLDKRALKEMGCAPWDEPDENGTVLMLFPGEWYSSITDGTPIESIFGEHKVFRRGETDDDIRFGCLSYGVRVRA